MRGAASVVLAVSLAACKPWVVRPLNEERGQAGRLDPAAYVESIWTSKVIPYVRDHAFEWGTVRDAVVVKGAGKVLRADTRILLDMPPYDGKADAAIPAGPVIRGTALRDAMPFIEFSQFVNQIEYARVGNELNARVQRDVVPRDVSRLVGTVVVFSGVATKPAAGELPEIIPVEFSVRRPS